MRLPLAAALLLIPVFTVAWRFGNRAHYEHWLTTSTAEALAGTPWQHRIDVVFDHLDGRVLGQVATEEERDRAFAAAREACPRYDGRLRDLILVESAADPVPPGLRGLRTDLQRRMAELRFDGRADKLPRYDDAALRNLADRFLEQGTGASLLLVGRTDAAGSADHNLELGARRATNVKERLVRFGVPAHRIGAVSLGETGAAADRDSDSRRVDLLLVPSP